MNPVVGILLIAIGSIGAASFYVPFKKVKVWAWESYWIVQGVAAWLIVPWIFAWFTVPSGHLMQIISESPASAKWLAMFFGALWGVGSLTFGLSMRYLGVAMGQSIALGFCAAFGTLIPPVFMPDSALTPIVILGVAICVAGIAIIGYAGALKNKNLSEEEKKKAVAEFALKKGIIIAIFAGIMSASFAFGFTFGKPIDEITLAHGTNPLYQSNVTLIFILFGGLVTNLIYCLYLNFKNGTIRDYYTVDGATLLNNIFFTFLAGFLWFLQFHFFGMGKSQLSGPMLVMSWSILMALNIAFSNIWGILLKEWKGVGAKTMIILVIGIFILIFSTFVVKL
jgi:L-rhamnose-H+ transport protein